MRRFCLLPRVETWALLGCVILGCVPRIPEGRIACTTSADCPSGFSCAADQRCHSGSANIDAGPTDAWIEPGTDGGTPDGSSCNAVMCGSDCVDTMMDSRHCGGCDRPCTSPDHGSAMCMNGTCLRECEPNYHLCGNTCASDTDVNQCGDDCVTCDATAPGVSSVACVDGACVPECETNFADCNSMPGCETDLTLPASCGSCTNRCGGAEFCDPMTHVCTETCAFTMCGGMCVDTMSDPAHCGGCVGGCRIVSNATMTCTAGRCGYVCDPGYMDMSMRCIAIPPPRAIGPLTDQISNSPRPIFRFELPAGTTRGLIEICSDPMCSAIVTSFSGTSPVAAPMVLSPGVYHWRIAGTVDGTTPSTSFSVPWRVVIFARGVATGNTVGPIYFNVHGRYDTAVGAPGDRQDFFYAGNDTGIGGGITSSRGGVAAQEGYSIAAAGDVNGDGLGDLIIGACGNDGDFSTAPTVMDCGNEAFVFYGQPDGSPSWDTATATRLTAPAGTNGFGHSVSSAGDFNLDGYADVIVGAYWSNQAFLYFGSASGIATTTAIALSGPGTGVGGGGGFFGLSVAGLGDTNGDGYNDVAVGAPSLGTVRYYQGSSTASTMTSWDINGASATTNLGISVTGVGDVNGDGYSDLVAGGVGGNGVVELHVGGLGGIASGAYGTWPGSSPSDQFGISVIGPGDLDGDGSCDFVVGAVGNQSIYAFTGGFMPSVLWRRSDSAVGFGRWLGRTGPIGSGRAPGIVVGACGPFAATCTPHAYIFEPTSTGLVLHADLLLMGSSTFGTGVVR